MIEQVRHFKIMNASGEVIDATTENHFFSNPQGLGYSRNNTYRQVGNRFVIVNSLPEKQTISGKVCLIGNNPYKAYFDLVQFYARDPLTILYKPAGQEITYERPAIVSRVEKTELNKYGYLEVSVEFDCLGPWYKRVSVYNVPDESPTNSSFIWDITWDVMFGTDTEMNAIIESDSIVDSPCKLTIYGPIINPAWTLYASDVEYSTGKVNVTVADGNVLVVDNTTDPYEIAIYTNLGTFIQNVYQDSDFTTKRFIDLQYGTNQIRVTGDLDEQETAPRVPIKVEALISYESV